MNVTTVLLVRHGSNDLLGKGLAGRAPGLRLNATGRQEAQAVARAVAELPISAMYTSPRERARDTAAPLEERLNAKALECAALDEVDFGVWTGRSFESLRDDPAWKVWVERRSVAQAPGGETFVDVQRRIVSGIESLCKRHGEATIALFSHGDVIKAALAHVLQISLDHLERFEIAPASISVIAFGQSWTQVKAINTRPGMVTRA